MNNDKNKYGGLKVERVYTSDAIKDLLQDLEHKKIAIRSRNARIKELEAQIEEMKCCSNCKHFNKEEDIEHCWNCERQLVNSLDNLKSEEIIKDEWEIKKMDKDEMKNRISMALKDPVLQQGFEIICVKMMI